MEKEREHYVTAIAEIINSLVKVPYVYASKIFQLISPPSNL